MCIWCTADVYRISEYSSFVTNICSSQKHAGQLEPQNAMTSTPAARIWFASAAQWPLQFCSIFLRYGFSVNNVLRACGGSSSHSARASSKGGVQCENGYGRWCKRHFVQSPSKGVAASPLRDRGARGAPKAGRQAPSKKRTGSHFRARERAVSEDASCGWGRGSAAACVRTGRLRRGSDR